MDQTRGNLFSASSTGYWESESLFVPVDSREFFIASHKGVDFYLVDLKQVDWRLIGKIIRACESVENECWKAQEVFFDYLQKCDVLSYAVKDNRVVGFDAVTLLKSGSMCIYSNDETMVLKEYRGLSIARNLVLLTMEWFFTQSAYLDGVTHLILLSISANPRVVNGYAKNTYMHRLFECSFKPSEQLIALKKEYCDKHAIELVDEAYPFAFKNLFPGSNSFDPSDERFQFSKTVRNNLPPDFDHMTRGDAFGFFVKTPRRAWRFLLRILMITFFGRTYLRLWKTA